MQKKVLQLLSLPIILLLCIVCSKLDQYTGVGSEIVNEADPMQVDFEKNIFAYATDTLLAVERSSLPNAAQSGFGYHSGKLEAGTHDGIRVYGFPKFTLNPDLAAKFDTLDVLDSITLIFDPINDTIQSGGSYNSEFRIFACTKDDIFIEPQTATAKPALSTLVKTSGDMFRFTGKIADSAFTDSIFTMCNSYWPCINNASGTDDEKQEYCNNKLDPNFYFTMVSNGDTIDVFKAEPAMIITTHREQIDSAHADFEIQTILDTIDASIGRDTVFFDETVVVTDTAREGNTTIIRISTSPISDTAAGQTAHGNDTSTTKITIRFNDTTIIINSTRINDTPVKADTVFSHTLSYRSDTLSGSSSILACETDSLLSSLSSRPVSTWLSQRTALFKLDMSSLWDTMASSGFDELLSAAIVFDSVQLATDHDTTPTIFYSLSEKLITDRNELDSLINTINQYYAPVMSLNLHGSDTIILPVERRLQNYITDKPHFLYLYLRITSDDIYGKQELLWDRPRLKAVLTTIK